MTRITTSVAAIAGLGALIAATPVHAAIDWSSVPGKDIVLFYPGQSSYEWALTASDMSGATAFRTEGKDCATCHVGEEKDMGPQIVTGTPRTFKTGQKPPIEPTPIAGKPGAIPATVKFANDGTNLYVHIDFKEGTQPDARQDPASATKFTVMFADKVPEFKRAGCWAACHDDASTMPSNGGVPRTKYLVRTRAKITRQGGGDALKPADELAKLKADGYFLEYWQARLNQGAAPVAAEGTIFDKREELKPASVNAEASFANGTWSVTLSSKMAAGPGQISFAPGGAYQVGIAIHAGHTAKRFHYVSFERSLAINSGAADFVAVKK
jgi:hypothetical protein